MDFGRLRDAHTDEVIRPATYAELLLSVRLEYLDTSQAGCFPLNGGSVYVDGEDSAANDRAQEEWRRLDKIR